MEGNRSMTAEQMTQEQRSFLIYTILHFQEVARQNRFAENGSIEHDNARCTICHPELLPMDPFEIYLEVATQSVKVRRPRLDDELIDEINSDLALLGDAYRLEAGSLLDEDPQAVECWSQWLKDALSTGLGLLSIHSPTGYDFSLDDLETDEWTDQIDSKVRELMEYQLANR